MLSATEYHMGETVPLATVHEAIFDFCRSREDVVIFGAQAVNLYTTEPRMTQDVNLLSERPGTVARELAAELHQRLGIAARVRELGGGQAYRIYQARKEGGHHLADVRRSEFPLTETTERDGVRYLSLPFLTAMKTLAYSRRRHAPKGATDLADLRRLLLAHSRLRADPTEVTQALQRLGDDGAGLEAWRELLAQPLVADEDVDEGY